LSDSCVDEAIATLEAQFRARRTRVAQNLQAVGRFWLEGWHASAGRSAPARSNNSTSSTQASRVTDLGRSHGRP
jgi:hypothetical protein